MIENRKNLENEIRMLEGNINRMCTTDDEEECRSMFKYSQDRITEIFVYNFLRIEEN